ncbi:MAG TPA: glycoside hydrolase family 3 N-terminal domain-containing protein [Bacteroidaceae bacterium]|nr:glycoside hydrolase family 3 N-terminal domain-containing protein [Bacteroidaceae bacterium]
MKKIYAIALLGWTVLMTTVGGSIQVSAQERVPTFLERAAQDSLCQAWVDSTLNTMSIKERVTQLFIYKCEVKTDPKSMRLLRKVVKEYKVGGLLFTGGKMLVQADIMNQAQKMSDIPLMMTFDGEWGLAMRLKEAPLFPRNGKLEYVQDNQLIYEYGREVARECRALGIQVNFAPDADVNTNPDNPVIGIRSFGRKAQNVADKVVAYAKGLEDGGVISVAKHFPGHGDTNQDSHKTLPLLKVTRARLDSIELCPFREYIDHGLSGIMVGHLEVPVLEPRKGVPSSMSKKVVTGLLQKEMGFKGLIFTDALEMKGAGVAGEKCLRALQAGNDMLLVPRVLRKEYERVMLAIKTGELSKEEITRRCRKVLTYKYMLGLNKKPQRALMGLESRINSKEAHALIQRLYEAASEGELAQLKIKNATVDIYPEAWTSMDSLLQDGIKKKAFPGCQLLILRHGAPVYDKCLGTFTYRKKKKVTDDAIYDLASVTKTSATLLAVMKLYDEGKINLSDRVAKYLPWMDNDNTGKITIKDLLFHESGLRPSIDVADILIDHKSYNGKLYQRYCSAQYPTKVWNHRYVQRRYELSHNMVSGKRNATHSFPVTNHLWANPVMLDSVKNRIANEPLNAHVYKYSCINFIVLWQMVEAITGQHMNDYLESQFYIPMGLTHTWYRPYEHFPIKQIVPTAKDKLLRGGLIHGYVHDETAAFLGGVSGNAGLFSTAHDLGRLYQMLLNGGQLDGHRYLSKATISLFSNMRSSISRRGLGFDRPEVVYNGHGPLPKSAPRSLYGHLGFTGTCAWVDPTNDMVFVFLSNRVYTNPWNRKLITINVRDKIFDIVYKNMH